MAIEELVDPTVGSEMNVLGAAMCEHIGDIGATTEADSTLPLSDKPHCKWMPRHVRRELAGLPRFSRGSG